LLQVLVAIGESNNLVNYYILREYLEKTIMRFAAGAGGHW
jgi:hypothetical protein